MKLNLYDENLNRIAIIGEQYISCLWSEGYNTVENFLVEVAESDEYKKKIKPGCYVGRSDRKTLMAIKTVQVSGGKIVASGKQATVLLSDVAFVGKIAAGQTIDTAIEEAYNNSNKYPNLVVASDGLEAAYNQEVSNKSFLELCEVMCQSTDTGFKAVVDNKRVSVRLYQPEERPELVFSQKIGNLSVEAVSLSISNLKNYAIVLSGDVRVDVDMVGDDIRREMIVDASYITPEEGESEDAYRERLYAFGVEALLQRQKVLSCAFAPYAKDFGTKYDLGDVLTVYLTEYGITLKSRVARFTQKSQNNKTETTIEVGKITIIKR